MENKPHDDRPLVVEEPMAAYGLSPSRLDTDLAIISEARRGVDTGMLWDFLKSIKSTKTEFEEYLPTSLKTFSRKKILDESTGERVLNIIRVFRAGEQLFGDVSRFKDWLRRYHPMLGDEPRSFLNTTTGCQVILDEIRRSQHGIMA